MAHLCGKGTGDWNIRDSEEAARSGKKVNVGRRGCAFKDHRGKCVDVHIGKSRGIQLVECPIVILVTFDKVEREAD